MKITYLFTTFPFLSERFLQREIEAMRELGVELELFSLFRGAPDFQGMPVHRFRWWQWMGLPFAFIREFRRYPDAFRKLLRGLRRGRPAGAINVIENILGVAFALVWAPHFRRTERHRVHAAWATGPATAALLLQDLAGTRFTLGAHAYDVFRDGGDWLLDTKLAAAELIHTSTEATKAELLRRGAPADRIVMIRRGLSRFPEMNPIRRGRADGPIRLLSVGRLIEKKGFDNLLRICAALRAEEIPFECRIAGGGPLAGKLRKLKSALWLDDRVCLTGAQAYAEVTEFYRWADLFCFTGKIASDNDRDGLPNVIPEAMAFGLPVLSAPVAGATEAIADGVNGYLIDPVESAQWVQAIRHLRDSDETYNALRAEARAWVETHFDARQNARRLLEAFEEKKARFSEEKRAGLK